MLFPSISDPTPKTEPGSACTDPVPGMSPEQTVELDFIVWGDNAAPETAQFVLRLVSDDAPAAGWTTFPVQVQFTEAKPALWFTPDHVGTGVSLDDSVTETLTLENRGYADLKNIDLELVNPDGSPAPDWVYLTTPASPADLSPAAVESSTSGQSTTKVDITFAPGAAVTEGNHEFRLRVEADNHATTDINLYAAVTQSGQGNVLFKVSDIYTGTTDDNYRRAPLLPLAAAIKKENRRPLPEMFGLPFYLDPPVKPEDDIRKLKPRG